MYAFFYSNCDHNRKVIKLWRIRMPVSLYLCQITITISPYFIINVWIQYNYTTHYNTITIHIFSTNWTCHEDANGACLRQCLLLFYKTRKWEPMKKSSCCASRKLLSFQPIGSSAESMVAWQRLCVPSIRCFVCIRPRMNRWIKSCPMRRSRCWPLPFISPLGFLAAALRSVTDVEYKS